ncbi:hypothetical protein SA231_05860 [Staphylococcus aureus]|nr:hypothetical protein SA231_05860 [Staphylococcus aureus]
MNFIFGLINSGNVIRSSSTLAIRKKLSIKNDGLIIVAFILDSINLFSIFASTSKCGPVRFQLTPPAVLYTIC